MEQPPKNPPRQLQPAPRSRPGEQRAGSVGPKPQGERRVVIRYQRPSDGARALIPAMLVAALTIGGCATTSAPTPGASGSAEQVTEPAETVRYEGEGALAIAMARYAEVLELARDRGEFETSEEHSSRRAQFDALRPDLRALEERQFLLTFNVDANPYDADRGLYPLRVSKPGLLTPAYAEAVVDRVQARRMKPSLSQAYGVAVIRLGHPHIQSVWLKTASGRVPVEFPSAWTSGRVFTGLPGAILSVDFSPDGAWLAAADVSGPAHLWDLRRVTHTTRIIPIALPRTRQDHPNAVAFSPDGATVVLGTHDARPEYWDIATDALTSLPLGHGNQVRSVTFSPNGARLVSASWDETARVWDARGGTPGEQLAGHGGGVAAAVFLTDQTVATGGDDGAVRLWNAGTGALERVLYEQPGPVRSLAVSSGLPLVAVGFASNGGIVVVSTDDGKVVRTFPKATPHVYSLVFAEDGRTLIAATSQAGIAVYDVVTGETLQTPTDGTTAVRSVALTGSGSLAASGADDGRVRLWYRVGADIPPIAVVAPPDAAVASALDDAQDALDAMVAAADSLADDVNADDPLAPAPVVGPRTYALIVGVDEYDSFPGLVNPVADAEAVEKELRENYGVETSLLGNATRADFLTQLHALAAREYEPDDQLLVFFSGHGWLDDVLKRGYLAMRDTAPLDEDVFRDTFVSHEDVRAVLERLDCRHVLLVIDSCFSGTLDPTIAMATGGRAAGVDMYEGIPRGEYIARKMKFATRRYITAGGKEFVPDGRPGQHSPFARQFLAALRNLGGDDGILTFEEMLQYLERVEPQPLSGELFGNEPGSSFILVKQDAYTAPAADTRAELATLDLLVTPAEAVVAITRSDGGDMTRRRSLRVEPLGSMRRYRLPTGAYMLHVSHPGYVDEVLNVSIVEGEQAVEITLERAP